MAECYLCADYIERGRGYRRTVQVESSTRVYISRRPGSSFGTRTALRTLCRRCAKVEDKVAKGSGLRQLCYVVGFGLSVWLGWQIIMHSEGAGVWLGLFFLLGIPVPIVAWMTDSMSRSLAESEAPTSLSTLDLTDTTNARRPRSACRAADGNDDAPPTSRQPSEGMTPELIDQASFKADDTIDTWASRATKIMRSLPNSDPEFNENAILSLAWHAKPRPGERFDGYFQRAISRRTEFEELFDIDCTPRRKNEAFPDYVARAGPYCVSYIPGLSLDDIGPALIKRARSEPLGADETIIEWTDRVLPRVIKSMLTQG